MSSLELLGARRVRELLAEHGADPKRSLGQNFVIDPNTIRKVCDVSHIETTDRVLEIGAGCGSLTLGLAAKAAHVIGVEIDDKLIHLLRDSFADVPNVSIVHADALSMPLADVDATVMVGNLPYNIATLLVLRALEEAPQIARITAMTQKEVGERLAAVPGSKSYGQTSVMVRYFGRAEVVAQISRRAFFPVPNVDSVVVQVTREPSPDVEHAALSRVVKAAFSQRRKTLRNTLGALGGTPAATAEVLEGAGISPGARAEELSLEDFVTITKALG
ncbi:MAG: rRNA (adenine1518-N6/adenine1519-N6)-dimethyltransferase [Actinomycetota bacterium]|jgi:16S rRNA (adenine1518-N6/adenine1519-N6)-dimethyltransferase|nr:rRNA (adenine1518-N6/adenine1519-N6)-dimethyltransferase [Actinomycetota bacterium]